MSSELLPHTLPWILKGLQDGDDDVRAVAAAALLPVAKLLGTTYPQEVSIQIQTKLCESTTESLYLPTQN